MAQVSKELFELSIVWNAGPCMHILMIKFIPFYGDTTHLDEFTSHCAWSVCTSYHQRRGDGRRLSECEQKKLLLQMCPLTPISCSLPTLWGVCSGRSLCSCEARDVSSYKGVVCDMPRQACSKTTENQGIKELKLGILKNAFCRISLKL